MAIACQRSDCIHNRGYCRRAEVGVEIDGNGRCSNYEAEGENDGKTAD